MAKDRVSHSSLGTQQETAGMATAGTTLALANTTFVYASS
jgi:hypothetical protein